MNYLLDIGDRESKLPRQYKLTTTDTGGSELDASEEEFDKDELECPAVQFNMFQEEIQRRFPNLRLAEDVVEPECDYSPYFLDISIQAPLLLVVEYRKDKGWGISIPTKDSGFEGHDTTVETLESAIEVATKMLGDLIPDCSQSSSIEEWSWKDLTDGESQYLDKLYLAQPLAVDRLGSTPTMSRMAIVFSARTGRPTSPHTLFRELMALRKDGLLPKRRGQK